MKYELTNDELQLLINILSEQKFKVVAGLIKNLGEQHQAQTKGGDNDPR